MKTVLLIYSIADFVAMLWTGYHPLALIVSFWVALALFHALAFHAQHRRARRHRDTLMRAMREAHE